MPYIKKGAREVLEGKPPIHPGELNYLITRMVTEYVARKPYNYATLNEVIGVLECAKQELYRRLLVPYENAKMEENGDVYV